VGIHGKLAGGNPSSIRWVPLVTCRFDIVSFHIPRKKRFCKELPNNQRERLTVTTASSLEEVEILKLHSVRPRGTKNSLKQTVLGLGKAEQTEETSSLSQTTCHETMADATSLLFSSSANKHTWPVK
jgi:hypothetical protein